MQTGPGRSHEVLRKKQTVAAPWEEHDHGADEMEPYRKSSSSVQKKCWHCLHRVQKLTNSDAMPKWCILASRWLASSRYWFR